MRTDRVVGRSDLFSCSTGWLLFYAFVDIHRRQTQRLSRNVYPPFK